MRIAVNGTSLFVDIEGSGLVPAGDTMREKPTLLLLHGGPGHDHSMFKPEYGRLADIAQIVYVDHRGNGRSPETDPATLTLDHWADDVRTLCDVLGITKPIVLGWSFGGTVAMNYAARHPDHPAKLILQSTIARWDVDRVAAGFRAEAGETAAMAAKAFLTEGTPESFAAFGQHCMPAYSPEPTFPSPEMIQAFGRMVLNPELTMDFMSRSPFDLRTALKSVRCPTLVVTGAHDPITSVATAAEIVANLPAAATPRFEVFENSGHFLPQTEGERFFALVRSFITDQP